MKIMGPPSYHHHLKYAPPVETCTTTIRNLPSPCTTQLPGSKLKTTTLLQSTHMFHLLLIPPVQSLRPPSPPFCTNTNRPTKTTHSNTSCHCSIITIGKNPPPPSNTTSATSIAINYHQPTKLKHKPDVTFLEKPQT